MLQVLSASGSKLNQQQGSSFLISNTIAVDAGSIIRPLGERSILIEHLFLTHSHVDHIIDLPFLIDLFFEKRTTVLNIYALDATVDALKAHLFNETIWPDFERIVHPTMQIPVVRFHRIEPEQTVRIDNIEITPVASVHTVEACGYIIKENALGYMISGDTGPNPALAERLDRDRSIKALLVDVSFPESLESIAVQSLHLTPKLLALTLEPMQRTDLTIFAYHLKPTFEVEIERELQALNLLRNGGGILKGGELLDLCCPIPGVISPGSLHAMLDSNLYVSDMCSMFDALLVHDDLEILLHKIIHIAIAYTHADAGTIYTLSDDETHLHFSAVVNRSLGIDTDESHTTLDWPTVPLHDASGAPNEKMVAARCALHNEIINIENVYADSEFVFEGTLWFDSQTGYTSKSMLAIPLTNHNHEVIGVLQLFNKSRQGAIVAFDETDEKCTKIMGSQAAIALSNAKLIEDFERLFEAFFNVISTAIDEKSSHTGGHVRRVSKIATLIAEAIASSEEGPYAQTRFSENELRQIRLAALLHDIGKISTPNHIMDKRHKLETVFNRIALIDERLEIVRRDAEIEYLNARLDAAESGRPERIAAAKQSREARQKELDRIKRFLHRINAGDARMDDADREELRRIAAIHYAHGDKTLPLITEEELAHLCIPSGTLTEDERRIVNRHAHMTFSMLHGLPFPRKYRRVPEIASNHHERLDGSGYPRGLGAESLSVEDRILILADLFDALVAPDRPYKKPHKLSEVFNILFDMAERGLIDSTLVRFVYEHKVFKPLALEELEPEQIDIRL